MQRRGPASTCRSGCPRPLAPRAGTLVNLPAILIVLLIMVLLVRGVRESARANAIMVAIKLAAVLFFIAVGARYVHTDNWVHAPYGCWRDVLLLRRLFRLHRLRRGIDDRGSEEPQRDLPIGIAVAGGVHSPLTWPWLRC